MIWSDVLYDFPKHQGYTPLNFIVDLVDWAVIAYNGEDENGEPYGTGRPQWRVAYVEDPNLPDDKANIMKRAHERVKRFINAGDGARWRCLAFQQSNRRSWTHSRNLWCILLRQCSRPSHQPGRRWHAAYPHMDQFNESNERREPEEIAKLHSLGHQKEKWLFQENEHRKILSSTGQEWYE